MEQNHKGRVLVAMSGGVDSSVAAIMLIEQGYEVIGITMKTWDYQNSGSNNRKETGCCSLDAIQDAREVAVELGFPHRVIDIRNEFGGHVIDYFTSEYLEGRTPNPCVLCNTHIKWEALLRRADALNCAWIATGHYAQVRKEKQRYILSKGVDKQKDQSYALWGLSQTCLSRTLFPLGHLTKPVIKAYAQKRGFGALAKKAESYEICFVPDNDYRSFLDRRIPGLKVNLAGGSFVNQSGKVLGQHQGYPFYTIGQRKGLGIALGYPAYVLAIDRNNNRIVLGPKKDLLEKHMIVNKLNWIKKTLPLKNYPAITKIRYNDPGTPAKISLQEHQEQKIIVNFETPVYAITPGQAAVFYDEEDVIGGGWINQAIPEKKKIAISSPSEKRKL